MACWRSCPGRRHCRAVPVAHELKAWLVAGSEHAGKRTPMLMNQSQSAQLNGQDPWVNLKDRLERPLAHPNTCIDDWLSHRWKPAG